MARVCPLFSGSSGNSCYIGSAEGGVLIDAGVSCKRLFDALRGLDIDPAHIRGVLVTHEHSDHIGGLRLFLARTGATLYASEAVLAVLERGGHVPPGTRTEPVHPGEPFGLGDATATGFVISHDSVGPLGYRLTLPDGRTAACATDMGSVPEPVYEALAGVDLAVLEANYDPIMLAGGRYPMVLKKRVMSARGHLANPESGRLAARLVASGTTRVILAHLSEENNRPDVARAAVGRALSGQGMAEGVDYMLAVAPRHSPGSMTVY